MCLLTVADIAELYQVAQKEGEDSFYELLDAIEAKGEAPAKLIAIAKLRYYLESDATKAGLDWADATPYLEMLPLEELKIPPAKIDEKKPKGEQLVDSSKAKSLSSKIFNEKKPHEAFPPSLWPVLKNREVLEPRFRMLGISSTVIKPILFAMPTDSVTALATKYDAIIDRVTVDDFMLELRQHAPALWCTTAVTLAQGTFEAHFFGLGVMWGDVSAAMKTITDPDEVLKMVKMAPADLEDYIFNNLAEALPIGVLMLLAKPRFNEVVESLGWGGGDFGDISPYLEELAKTSSKTAVVAECADPLSAALAAAKTNKGLTISLARKHLIKPLAEHGYIWGDLLPIMWSDACPDPASLAVALSDPRGFVGSVSWLLAAGKSDGSRSVPKADLNEKEERKLKEAAKNTFMERMELEDAMSGLNGSEQLAMMVAEGEIERFAKKLKAFDSFPQVAEVIVGGLKEITKLEGLGGVTEADKREAEKQAYQLNPKKPPKQAELQKMARLIAVQRGASIAGASSGEKKVARRVMIAQLKAQFKGTTVERKRIGAWSVRAKRGHDPVQACVEGTALPVPSLALTSAGRRRRCARACALSQVLNPPKVQLTWSEVEPALLRTDLSDKLKAAYDKKSLDALVSEMGSIRGFGSDAKRLLLVQLRPVFAHLVPKGQSWEMVAIALEKKLKESDLRMALKDPFGEISLGEGKNKYTIREKIEQILAPPVGRVPKGEKSKATPQIPHPGQVKSTGQTNMVSKDLKSKLAIMERAMKGPELKGGTITSYWCKVPEVQKLGFKLVDQILVPAGRIGESIAFMTNGLIKLSSEFQALAAEAKQGYKLNVVIGKPSKFYAPAVQIVGSRGGVEYTVASMSKDGILVEPGCAYVYKYLSDKFKSKFEYIGKLMVLLSEALDAKGDMFVVAERTFGTSVPQIKVTK